MMRFANTETGQELVITQEQYDALVAEETHGSDVAEFLGNYQEDEVIVLDSLAFGFVLTAAGYLWIGSGQ